ncbi:hypothetical protein RE428_03960 [Marinobacter nanhaiticus D15-8W]|uniref:Uncharacterized protein n=2 Tax=Marinobacter TaxID=2742 RepID=N6WTS9_9GAMM|nr:hypothetical protein [Marinobacter nanhaiticus]ENO14926.2 hypothetical protein J057_06236 [Marinobacter nanhaiticus D15-8W]BES69378.1 hypothetical protein RE428_03960 [Marinobacter nanhaiticus D15-8W]
MRVYVKILSAIVVALVLLSLLASIALGVTRLSPTGEIFFLPLFIAFAGFLMFGISGSLLWLLFFRLLDPLDIGSTAKHALAVTMATPSSILFLALLLYLASGEAEGVSSTLSVFGWFVVPVAATSVGCYWWLFLADRYDAE